MNLSQSLGISETFSQWIELTFVVILVFLILSRASGFSSILRTSAGAYVNAVKALQGR